MTPDLAAKIVALSFSVAIMCGVELACSVYLAKQTPGTLQAIRALLVRDPELFWRQAPNHQTQFFGAAVDTDEYGLRNARGAIDGRDAREYRVVVLGASPSFGWGVPDRDTYARALERRLQPRSPDPVKVINASVIGYSSLQGLRLLRKSIERWSPDHLVVAYGINDVTRERFFYSGNAEDKDLRVSLPGIMNWVFGLATTRVLAAIVKPARLDEKALQGSPVRVALEDFKENHREMARLARAHGSTVSFLVIPFRFPSRDVTAPDAAEMFGAERRSKVYFQAVRQVAREESIPLTDTTTPLYDEYERYFLVAQHDYIHPNAAGHAVIGERLARTMEEISAAKVGESGHP